MSTPTWSLLHATYGRPEKAIAAKRMALERAANPERVEYIFACNHDDQTRPRLLGSWMLGLTKNVIGNFAGSAPAWNAAAAYSSGTVLIQMADDLELPPMWDTLLTAVIVGDGPHAKHPNPWYAPLFIAVSDGYRKDALCTCAIMTRTRYEQAGEFLHPNFYSVYSDDDVTYRALRDARDEKCYFVDTRKRVTFLHRHHLHDAGVPNDQTYARGNSAEAYRIGAELFAKRNPEAATDGLRTWG